MKLLALDIEGTIITNYDYNKMVGDRFQAIIDSELKNVLALFHHADFKIVCATGTDSDNLAYYKNEFKRAGIDNFIDAYLPQGHEASDSKEVKLTKFTIQFGASAKDVYFFDDAMANVERAIHSGYVNAARVTTSNTLTAQLKKLAATLNLQSAEKDAATTATAGKASQNGLFGSRVLYKDLSLLQRQYLSAATQKARHEEFCHVSTEHYWDSILTNEERNKLQSSMKM